MTTAVQFNSTVTASDSLQLMQSLQAAASLRSSSPDNAPAARPEGEEVVGTAANSLHSNAAIIRNQPTTPLQTGQLSTPPPTKPLLRRSPRTRRPWPISPTSNGALSGKTSRPRSKPESGFRVRKGMPSSPSSNTREPNEAENEPTLKNQVCDPAPPSEEQASNPNESPPTSTPLTWGQLPWSIRRRRALGPPRHSDPVTFGQLITLRSRQDSSVSSSFYTTRFEPLSAHDRLMLRLSSPE